jgi:hypothetical protein
MLGIVCMTPDSSERFLMNFEGAVPSRAWRGPLRGPGAMSTYVPSSNRSTPGPSGSSPYPRLAGSDRWGVPDASGAIPSNPSLQACRKIVARSPSVCSLRWTPGLVTFLSRYWSLPLRSPRGWGRRSGPTRGLSAGCRRAGARWMTGAALPRGGGGIDVWQSLLDSAIHLRSDNGLADAD